MPQLAQLSGRGNAAGDAAVPAHPQRQEFRLGQRLVLHGLQDRRVREQQAGAAQLFGRLLGQLIRGDVAFGSQNVISCRKIQYTGRLHFAAEIRLALLLQGEEVQQHLDVQPHPHRRQIKGLAAGLIVYHPQIELAVFEPSVYPVHFAAQA